MTSNHYYSDTQLNNNQIKISNNIIQNPFISPHPLDKLLSPKVNDVKNSKIITNRYGTF
jgi:hypothetical protein